MWTMNMRKLRNKEAWEMRNLGNEKCEKLETQMWNEKKGEMENVRYREHNEKSEKWETWEMKNEKKMRRGKCEKLMRNVRNGKCGKWGMGNVINRMWKKWEIKNVNMRKLRNKETWERDTWEMKNKVR